MLNRTYLFVSASLLLALHAPYTTTMENNRNELPATYITQCCNKQLSDTDYRVAKDISKKTKGECPYCDTKPFEVRRQSNTPFTSEPTISHPNFTMHTGAPYSGITPQASGHSRSTQPTNTNSCRLCFDSTDKFPELSCNHNYYCTECLSTILNNAVREKTTQAMKCPKCSKKFPQADLLQLTKSDRHQLRQINYLIQREEQLATPGAKECKTEGCSYIHKPSNNNIAKIIYCPECKKPCCSLCFTNHNVSMSCQQANVQRIATDKNEQAFENWKKDNTKPCPNCSAAVEKYKRGCSKVECTCNTVFCYDCLERTSWSKGHNCKRSTKEELNDSDTDNNSDSDTYSKIEKLIKLLILKQAIDELRESQRKDLLQNQQQKPR